MSYELCSFCPLSPQLKICPNVEMKNEHKLSMSCNDCVGGALAAEFPTCSHWCFSEAETPSSGPHLMRN